MTLRSATIRRTRLAAARARAANQLRDLVSDLVPGEAPKELTAREAAELLTTVCPTTTVGRAHKRLARDLVVEVRTLDAALAALARLDEHASIPATEAG